MNRFPRFVLIAVALAMSASVSNAAMFTYKAVMNAASESPPVVGSNGTGNGKVVYDDVAHTLYLEASWTGLTGTTTNSHIHAATLLPNAGTAGVATTTPTFAGFPSGVTSGNYINTINLTLASSYNPAFVTANGGTTASAEVALIAALNADKAYWNIHSTFVSSGEIRGFLHLVPEPATLSLLAFAGLLLRRRR